MKPLEYTAAIVKAVKENDIDKAQRIRKSYEWESSLNFDADSIVAITLVRAALGQLGINNEPYIDYDCDESQYGKVVLAYSKELQKSSVPHEEIRIILDKYRIGGVSYKAALNK